MVKHAKTKHSFKKWSLKRTPQPPVPLRDEIFHKSRTPMLLDLPSESKGEELNKRKETHHMADNSLLSNKAQKG
jgi:hypothetical protein